MLDPPWKRPPAPDGKYLIIARSDNNNDGSLAKVSPFTLKKIIDVTVGGVVEECKKLRDGNILIKTKNQTQTDKLLNLKMISGDIPVTVSEHRSLNTCKGVIYCPDLNGKPRKSLTT